MKKVIRNNIFSFILGALLFGGITYAVATSIQSSNLNYTTTKNTAITNVEEAINDLYNVKNNWISPNTIKSTNTYEVYWESTQGGSGTAYAGNAKPTTTYNTLSQLNLTQPDNFIKTTINSSGTVTGHETCIYYNNRTFCFGPGYWTGTIGVTDETAGNNTMAKLKKDVESALGVKANPCGTDGTVSYCYFGNISCGAYSNGGVSWYDGSKFCTVYINGYALCQ